MPVEFLPDEQAESYGHIPSRADSPGELLRMLRFTAAQHDRAVLATPSPENAGQVDAAPRDTTMVDGFDETTR